MSGFDDSLSTGKQGLLRVLGPRPGARRRKREGDPLDRVLSATPEMLDRAMGRNVDANGATTLVAAQ